MIAHRYWLILLMILLVNCLMGCAVKTVKQDSTEVKETKPENAGFLLMFAEKRPFEPEGTVRMIITDQFLRIDEGAKSEDFILFDRERQSIFNVVKEDQSILTIKPEVSRLTAPFSLQWVVQSQTSQVLMRSESENGAAATHYLYVLNDQPCYNLVTINNQLVETLDALREYNQVLANELKTNYQEIEGQQCNEAINIFDPNIRLQNGFPLREWSVYGYQRFLVDYQKDVIFPESLFLLPKHYENIKL